MRPTPAQEEAKLRGIFDQCDTNGDGTLNKRELIKMCRASVDTATFFGLPANIRQEDGTRDLLEAKFQKMDQNSDREVNWEEFCEWYECEVLLEQERASQLGNAEAEAKMTSEDMRVNVKRSLFGEDDDTDSQSEDELPPPPAHTGFASIQALTSMASDGRPLVEDVEEFEEEVQEVQPSTAIQSQEVEKFLEFIFDQVQSQGEDQGITRRDLEEALRASIYGSCFEQFDGVSEDLALQPLGPLEFLDHFLMLDPAEPLHGFRLCQPIPNEPWPEIHIPKHVQHPPAEIVEETPTEPMLEETSEAIAALASTKPVAMTEDTAEAVQNVATTAVEVSMPAATVTDASESLPQPVEPVEPVEPVTMMSLPPVPAMPTATMPTDTDRPEAQERSESHATRNTALIVPMEALVTEDAEDKGVSKALGDVPQRMLQVQPCSVEVAEYKAEASDTEEEEVLQIIEVPPAQSKSTPPKNWFSDDVVPIVPPPPALPDVVQQQDPSGGLPLIPSARGNPSEREAWHTETALATLDSQNLALPCSVTVGPALTFQDAIEQSPSADHEVAIMALPFEASPVDVGSAPPESSRTEPLSLFTPRTDDVIVEAPLALTETPSPAPVSKVRQLVDAESRELVPVSEEPRRSSCTRTETHPTSQPQALQPAIPSKPQSGFAQHRLSQICLRDSDAPQSSAADGGSTIHDDFRQLPRKLQAQVVNLYQELEDAKNSKHRAEQENTEIMNYLSAILSDDRPEQFALMDGPLESLTPEPQEEGEKQHQQLPPDAAAVPKETTASPQQLEPPPPLPFPSEHLEASAQAPPAPTPDFLTKPLVSINFGGGPPEGWGGQDRRSDHVLQDSFASVLPMAFRQLFERPQSEREQYVQDRQQLQEGLQLMQQQLQLLQQQLQGKSESQPSQRSLLEQLRAELAAERRQMHEQQRQQFQQDQKLQEFQQQQIQQQLEQQIHELQLQVQQQQAHQQQAQAESAPSEMQKMMAELRKSGEATLGEIRAALEELRQSKEHRGNDGSREQR